MFTVTAAAECILNLVQPFHSQLDCEEVHLSESIGRILATDIQSDLDFPHWSNSAMDGYALRHADLEKFTTLAIASQDIPADIGIPQPLALGECARIFTGGMLPSGADTIIMQEDTERDGDRLHLKIKPNYGDYVRQQGEFYRAGTTLLTAGTKVTPTELGAIAALNCAKVKVYRQPVVAIFSTGNELKSLDDPALLQKGQIIDSNQYALASLLSQSGAIPLQIGIVPDRKQALAAAIEQAITSADIVISSGGVSVGDYDYVEEVLAQMQAEIHIRSVAIKPGKPLTVATINRHFSGTDQQVVYFGVPGNPVSAMVSFWRFVAGAIAKLKGEPLSTWQPQFFPAITLKDLHAQGRRETYLWGRLSLQAGKWQFQPTDNYSSGNVINIAGTNALAVLKVNQTYVPAGDVVSVMLTMSY